MQAVNETIAPEIIGYDARLQGEIDELLIELDGTDKKEDLGANSLLGVSLAVARLLPMELGFPCTDILGAYTAPTFRYPSLIS